MRETLQVYLSHTLCVLFLLASSALFFDAVTFKPNESQCDDRMSPWTPAKDAIRYEWTMFPAIHFLAHSEYFDSPLPEREEAWRELLPNNPIAIPTSHLSRLNLTNDMVDFEYIASPNNPSTILALPEVFIQLHCLNLLRLHGQRDEVSNYDLPSFKGSSEQVYQRLEQCLDRLRTTFRCWSDIAPILMYFEGGDKKYDFGTKHRCRDFGAIREWTVENGVMGVEMVDGWWGGGGLSI